MPFYACIENLHDMPNLNKVTEVMTSYIWLSSPLETRPSEYLTPFANWSVFHWHQRPHLWLAAGWTCMSPPGQEGAVSPSVLSSDGIWLCAVTSFAGRWRAIKWTGLMCLSSAFMPFLFNVKGTSFGQSQQMHFFLNFHWFSLTRS